MTTTKDGIRVHCEELGRALEAGRKVEFEVMYKDGGRWTDLGNADAVALLRRMRVTRPSDGLVGWAAVVQGEVWDVYRTKELAQCEATRLGGRVVHLTADAAEERGT